MKIQTLRLLSAGLIAGTFSSAAFARDAGIPKDQPKAKPEQTQPTGDKEKSGKDEVAILTVANLTKSTPPATITKLQEQIKKVEGVSMCTVNQEKGQIEVRMKQRDQINQVTEAIKASGFTVTKSSIGAGTAQPMK